MKLRTILTLVTILSFAHVPAMADSSSSLAGTVATSTDSVYALESGGTTLAKYNAADMTLSTSVSLTNKGREVIISGDTPIVISKSGASTFMEILLTKKLPVISSYLWEQEKGNVDFITNNNLGIYETSSKKIAKFCSEILSDSEKYKNFQKNISSKKIENGTEKIADFIISYREKK